jgi:hypothetical protein
MEVTVKGELPVGNDIDAVKDYVSSFLPQQEISVWVVNRTGSLLQSKEKEKEMMHPRVSTTRFSRRRLADPEELVKRPRTRHAVEQEEPLDTTEFEYDEAIEVDPNWSSMGKFDHAADEVVYDWVLDGWAEELGDESFGVCKRSGFR